MLTVLFSLRDCFRARAALQAEILALRHQLLVLQRSSRGRKLRLRWADRVLWVWLSRLWNDWRSALLLVKPETVIAWHRKEFRLYWNWKSRHLESDPENEPRQPSLGSSPHSRRIAEDCNRGVASHGRQVHGPASEAALPNMANLFQKSRQRLGFCRLLRGPDDSCATFRCPSMFERKSDGGGLP
jgi:hypothetical protein